MSADHQLAGRTLAGRYDLIELLGAGGMGAVYRARDRELDEFVALKVIHGDLVNQPELLVRFRHEVKLARRVTHVNIARVFELGHADGIVFCTMELVAGESLRHLLERGPPSVIDAISIITQLCAGLSVAHAAGVIHRDIKPDNILLGADGRVVLADFGVAAIPGVGFDVSGTPSYMSPEQARGEPPEQATDVYAVGVVLYELLAYKRAFVGAPGVLAKQELPCLELAPSAEISAELAAIVARATARDRVDRVASVAELAALLAPWAHPSALASAAPQVAGSALHDVIVLAPRGDAVRVHLAEGVHEALLRRLSEHARLRVLPRVWWGEDVPENATIVELDAGAAFSVTIRRPDAMRRLWLPLEIAELELTASAIASAVVETLARAPAEPHRSEVRDLVLRGRHLVRGTLADVMPAAELLDRAGALAPDDPQVAATHAFVFVRSSVSGENDPARIARATELVRTALVVAPDLADAHLAAGHLELHVGDSALAALHFRRAIACSPWVADGHEALGRMLIEAGFLEAGFARLEVALAIAPNLSSTRWEIARAWALEGRWDLHDALVAELMQHDDRPIARLRFAFWRHDLATTAALRAHLSSESPIETMMIRMLMAVALDGAWPIYRDALVSHVLGGSSKVRRRRALLGQLVADAAGFAGDAAVCQVMVDHATEQGLYDLHWIDRSPLLGPARGTPAFGRARARIEQRAHAIVDAFYGDVHRSEVSETVR